MHKDILEILLTEDQIQSKVAELGKQIAQEYVGKNLLLLGTLKGAVPFIADLARAIELPLEIDYMAVFKLWQQHAIERRCTYSERSGRAYRSEKCADCRRYRR